MVRSSVVAGFAAAAICACITPSAAFSSIPSSALCSRGAVQGSLCKAAPNALNTRRPTGGSLQLRASGSPPPPPSTGTKTLSKTEKSELNLQMWDAAKNGETETLVRLVQAGAQINYYQPEMLQATALQWAATNGHIDTTAKLLEIGASLKPTNQYGWTALHHAANWGYDGCVRVLIQGGADPNTKSESGKTAAECAAFKGYDNVLSVIVQMAPDGSGVSMPTIGSASNSVADIVGFDSDQTMVAGAGKWGQEDYSVWRDSWGDKDS